MKRSAKRTRIAAALAAACPFAAVFTTAAPAQGQAQSQSQSQERPVPMDPAYTVLLERSIFSKDGRSRSATRPATAPAAPPVRVLTPEQSNVFRGVLCPDEEYVAFIENVQTGQVSVLRAGDDVAGGKIVGITLDSLAFAGRGKVHDIRLGQNLAGEAVGSAPTTPSAGGSVGTAPSASPTPSDPAQAAALERMRQRRLQEGGR